MTRHTIKYRAGYKYVLAEGYRIRTNIRPGRDIDLPPFLSLSALGWLEIAPGYAWDGPSGPVLDIKSFQRASLVHDALYQLMREGALDQRHKNAADRLMRKICIQDGMSLALAEIAYQGVATFGAAYGLKKSNDILTAP